MIFNDLAATHVSLVFVWCIVFGILAGLLFGKYYYGSKNEKWLLLVTIVLIGLTWVTWIL